MTTNSHPHHRPSFSLGHRARRQLWYVVQALLFRSSLRPMHRWRVFLLRCFGAKIGRDCHIYPGVIVWAPWNLCLGDCVGIADGVTLYSVDRIEIGDYAVISQGSHLCCGTHDYNSPHFPLIARPIVIGKRAWICAEVFIHPGIEIAAGVVVGARSVVNKSLLLPWRVCTGNPCRPVAERNNFDWES